MNKEELLSELSIKLGNGEISKEEVVKRFNLTSLVKISDSDKNSSHFSTTKIFYILGAAIAVLGIIIFVSQIWNDIGSFGRILTTLGLGLLFTSIGSMLLKKKPEDNIGTIFHFIGGVLIPGGAIVTLSELMVDSVSSWSIAITFGVIFAFYLLLNFVHKNAVLTFFAIANGTAFVYTLVQAITGGLFYENGDLYAYLTMIMGASYLLLSYAFRDGWNSKLIGTLYFFGIVGFLGAAFSRVFGSTLWQVIYFVFIACGILLSVYMRNRTILIISTLFLVAHISYITSEYFADSLGWPISLVILGFMFIGLGYLSVRINKKYITN